jgi:hypothetical protein
MTLDGRMEFRQNWWDLILAMLSPCFIPPDSQLYMKLNVMTVNDEFRRMWSILMYQVFDYRDSEKAQKNLCQNILA